MKKKVIVLAGNWREFEHYRVQNRLRNNEAIYGCEEQRIYGLRAGEVVIVGTFWDREDAEKLKALADIHIF